MGELCAARLTVNPESLSDQDAVVSLLVVLRFFAEGADLWLDKALLHVRIHTDNRCWYLRRERWRDRQTQSMMVTIRYGFRGLLGKVSWERC